MATDFLTLGIHEKLANILKKNSITEPTPIQQRAIPELLRKKDIIAQAQTGTGKTLAFALPIMERLAVDQPFIQAMVITPTRELALQVTKEVKKLAAYKGSNVLAVYGGQDVDQQVKKLKGAIHIVIGTPGRLLDHIRRKSIDLSKVTMLILDEADQMLDMGFLKDVEQIIHQTPKTRQTMLFSATVPKEIRSLASKYMREPIEIRVQSKNITLAEIRQEVIETTDRSKQDALCKVIEEYRPFMGIIFCRTKRRTSALNEALRRRGYNSDELHGDLTQAKREKVMKAFRQVKTQFLVATDVAARGLDIEGVTHVFNFDIPQDPESYIHRIGRTGRAGQAGVAVTFVSPKDRKMLHLIENSIKTTLQKRRMLKEELRGIEEEAGSDRREPYREKSTSKQKDGLRGKSRGKSRRPSTAPSSKRAKAYGGSKGKSKFSTNRKKGQSR